MHDLAIIITAMNEGRWLRALLPTIRPHAGNLSIDIVVADIESTDDTSAIVEATPGARRVPVINRGFAHANNVALATVDAAYVLFLNADTEIVDGTLADLLHLLREDPVVGMLGVRQLDSQGRIYPTMRRFAAPWRAMAEALGCEKFAPTLGQRVLDLASYDQVCECEWTIGSFMLVRIEALASTGTMDERFFFTGEEQDFCLRMTQAGWKILHSPAVTIVHHVGKRGPSPQFAAQLAFSELQYGRKHFSPAGALWYRVALAVNHALRSLPGAFRGSDGAARRAAARAALTMVVRDSPGPFIDPPPTAMPAGSVRKAKAGEPA